MAASEKREGEIPTVDFDTVYDGFRGRGVDIRDLMGSDGHFSRWHKARGLPRVDADGKDAGSSRIYMQMYRDDPEGEAACPPYVDFWHWLTRIYESVPWTEGRGSRHKDVPLVNGIYTVPTAPSDQDLQAGRARLARSMGVEITDEMWEPIARDARLMPLRSAKALEIVAQIVAEHGVDLGEGMGRMVRLRMQVSC